MPSVASGRSRSGARDVIRTVARHRICCLICFRYRSQPPLNSRIFLTNTFMDIKRTVLWVVFSLSLLILWDKWMTTNGKPSMFFPTATQIAKPATGTGATGGGAKVDVAQASAIGVGATGSGGAAA